MRLEAEEAAIRVKARAVELGFDACGIAEAGNIDPEGRLKDWLERGYHADMDWMARTAVIRANVRLKLHGARSVVVVARNYFAERPGEVRSAKREMDEMDTMDGMDDELRGRLKPADSSFPTAYNLKPKVFPRVSRYAWGRDYHRVLLKPLRALADAIRALPTAEVRGAKREGNSEFGIRNSEFLQPTAYSLQPTVSCYTCIDSGPVLERAYAARAGIGWIGKNSLVVREDLGSWFFLGVVVTTAELAPDAPVPNRCGTCTRCIEACPTGAIIEPGVVDARRCISYHTIENRGEIPVEIREHMDGWIFGCDACQEVCPWNRSTHETTEPDFFPRPELANPDIEEWLDMDEATFDRLTSGSPLRRAKYSGIQRNLRKLKA